MSTATTSLPSNAQRNDSESEAAWRDTLRKEVEKELQPLVEKAREERAKRLSAQPLTEEERSLIETNYKQEMESLRHIAEETYAERVAAERKRRLLQAQGRRGVQIAESSVMAQQRILDAIKGGSGEPGHSRSETATEAAESTTHAGPSHSANHDGQSMRDTLDGNGYVMDTHMGPLAEFLGLSPVSSPTHDPRFGSPDERGVYPHSYANQAAIPRKTSSGSMSSTRSRIEGWRAGSSPKGIPSASRAYELAVSSTPDATVRRDGASSSVLRSTLAPVIPPNPSPSPSNLMRRDSNASVASSKSGITSAKSSFARRDSDSRRFSPMAEHAKSPAVASPLSHIAEPIRNMAPISTVVAAPSPSPPPPQPPPPPPPPPPPAPRSASRFLSGISSTAPATKSPMALDRGGSRILGPPENGDTTDGQLYEAVYNEDEVDEPRSSSWYPFPQGPKNLRVRHSSSVSDLYSHLDVRPGASPVPVISPDSPDFPQTSASYGYRPGSRLSNLPDNEKRVGVPIPPRSSRSLHAPQGSPELVRPLRSVGRGSMHGYEHGRYSRSPEASRALYEGVFSHKMARRNSAGSYRSGRSSRSQSIHPDAYKQFADEWTGPEMPTHEEQSPPRQNFDLESGWYGGMFDTEDDLVSQREWETEIDELADELRKEEERLNERETELVRGERELKKKLDDVRRIEDAAKRREVEAKRREEDTKRKEDEVKRKEDALMRREDEFRKREEEVREMEDAVRRREDEARRREEDARRKEDDARRKEDDARKREIDARKKEEDARQKIEEARQKAEEVRRSEEELRMREEALRCKEDVLSAREEALSQQELEWQQREEESTSKASECRARDEAQQVYELHRMAAETAAAEQAKAEIARQELERQRAAALAREATLRERESNLRKREEELEQQAQRRRVDEERSKVFLTQLAQEEHMSLEDMTKEQRRRMAELTAQQETERLAQQAAEKAQQAEKHRADSLAEQERQARSAVRAQEEEKKIFAEIAERKRQATAEAEFRRQQELAQQREEELRRRAEDAKRQNTTGNNSPDTHRSGTPHSPAAWSNPRHSTASSSSDRASTASSSWGSTTGSTTSGWSWTSWQSEPASSHTSGTSRTSASSSTSTTKATGGAWRAAASGGNTASEPSPRKQTDEKAWKERQEDQARKQAEQFKKEQEKLERERQLKGTGRMMTKAEYAHLVEEHDRQWSYIQVAESIGWNDIPWPMLKKPQSPDDMTTAAVAGYVLNMYNSGERSEKDRLKEHLRRWHPDRFDTKLLPKVQNGDRDRVRDGAGRVVRSLNELMTQAG